MIPRDFRILLVEDCPGDIGLIRHILKSASVRLTIAQDGDQALRLLNGGGEMPELILLDLNLPKRPGLEVLKEIKSSEDLRRIPVAVLTSSGAESDVQAAYELGANCYVVKPVAFDDFHAAITETVGFWKSIVSLPTHASRLTATA